MGYKLSDDGAHFRSKPIYRESDNFTSLRIDKISGSWIDFSASLRGNLEDLIKITLNLPSKDDAKKLLKDKFSFDFTKIEEKPVIKMPKIVSLIELEKLEPDHGYWQGRGISAFTMFDFKGGICKEGKMKGRYVIPIFDSKGKVIGLTGRKLEDKGPGPKWKHLNSKTTFIFPAYQHLAEIKKAKEVILAESPACIFALAEAGIKNAICLFGTDCSTAIINFLLKMDPDLIIIALNNEPDNNGVGNSAAIKTKTKLSRYFDKRQLEIRLPQNKDFAEQTREENIKWHQGEEYE